MKPPSLLTNETEIDFNALRAELEEEIAPKGVIERIMVDDIAVVTSDIYLLRRYKAGIIRNALIAGLERLLNQLFARNKRPRQRRIKPKPMPPEEPRLTAEAMHRAIPDLVSVGRFEAAAAARLHRGVRTMLPLGRKPEGTKFGRTNPISCCKINVLGEFGTR